MKKIIIAFVFVLTSVAVSAQSYRGFIDFFGGIGMGDDHKVERDGSSFYDINTPAAFGLSTTHGCQITPWFYAGLGVGVYGYLDHAVGGYDDESYTEISSFFVPIYFDLRWDLNIRKKITPYVDLKLGYQKAFNPTDYATFGDTGGNYLALKMEGDSGFYFRPTVGVRFRMGKKSGFNLGVSYNPVIRKVIKGNDGGSSFNNDEDWESRGGQYFDAGKVTDGALMLDLGFDF